MQGVRQAGPSDVRASAPGGSDSIVSETLAPLVMLLGRKFQLEVLQPPASKAPPMAQTRTKDVMSTLRFRAPAFPRRDHKGRGDSMQSKAGDLRLNGVRED